MRAEMCAVNAADRNFDEAAMLQIGAEILGRSGIPLFRLAAEVALTPP